MNTFLCIFKIMVIDMIKLAEKILDKTSELLSSTEFVDRHKTTETSFLRNRVLGFKNIMGICLNFSKRTLQVEIDDYFYNLKTDNTVTKQAFSKQRTSISPTAFTELFNLTVDTIFKDKAIKSYKGHRFFAIDGSIHQLPRHKGTADHFGTNASSAIPEARVSALCDVLSNFLIHTEISSNKVDERTLAKKHLDFFLKYKKSKDVVIFDRGYPSKGMIDYLHKNKIKYIIRLPKNYNKTIQNSTENDFFITIDGHRFRVIQMVLDSGEKEILATNLGRKAFLWHEFKELYHFRWAIETRYDTLKNKLRVETFSGKTVTAVLQDFYATMYLANVTSAVKLVTDEMIFQDIFAKKSEGKVYKHDYKTNENVLIGTLKNKLIFAIIKDSKTKRKCWLHRLVNRAYKRRISSPKNRVFPRDKGSSGKITEKPKFPC